LHAQATVACSGRIGVRGTDQQLSVRDCAASTARAAEVRGEPGGAHAWSSLKLA
jgi:hypothetical protein